MVEVPSPPARRRVSPELAALGWMLLATLGFSLMSLCVRLAARHVPWTEVAAARAGVGALVALGVARLRGSTLRINNRRAVWGRTLFGTLAKSCTFFALAAPAIAVGDVATLRGTAPILIALLGAVVLRERAGRRVVLAVPLAFAGVLILVQPQFGATGNLALLALGGSLFSAVAMIFMRVAGPHESPEAIAFHFSSRAAVVMAAASLPFFVWPDLEGAFWLTAAGVLGGGAQLAVTRAYSRERAGRVGVVGYFGIVTTQWFGVVLLGESIGAHQVLGSTLVVSGGVVLAWAAFRDARRAPAPQAARASDPSDRQNPRTMRASSSGASS